MGLNFLAAQRWAAFFFGKFSGYLSNAQPPSEMNEQSGAFYRAPALFFSRGQERRPLNFSLVSGFSHEVGFLHGAECGNKGDRGGQL
jgi:hypothetical protein